MNTLKTIFIPFRLINKTTAGLLIVFEILFALFIWQMFEGGLIPSPQQVSETFFRIITSEDFIINLGTSAWLTCKAMFISILISMGFGYLSTIPVFKPVVAFVVKCRYLTLTGLIFLFTLLTKDGSQLKISLLIFGIVPFFVTGLVSVFEDIEQQQYELCKTLRMNNFETLWEIVIVGKLDKVFEVMRQNFAISWMMITMVEGLSMSEGGIGTMLIKANKYIDLSSVFSLLIIIFLLGILFDFLLGAMRKWLFPYANK